jgi:hypothetical protein
MLKVLALKLKRTQVHMDFETTKSCSSFLYQGTEIIAYAHITQLRAGFAVASGSYKRAAILIIATYEINDIEV